MDLVRALYAAINRSDAGAVAACYHPSCVVECVFVDDDAVREGRAAVEGAWAREFERFTGAGPAGQRFDVRQVSGIETGWGWARADWRRVLRDRAGREHDQTGYSHFWVEDGLVRLHRSVMTPGVVGRRIEGPPEDETRRRREYPVRPIVGVGAVILNAAREVVLVKRRYEPLAGQWSLPGGTQEVGEHLEIAVAREVREETGLMVEVGPVVEVFDRILADEAGRVRFHYVIVDYLCRAREGRLLAGSDVTEVARVNTGALAPYRLTGKALSVIGRALAMGALPAV